MSTFRTGGVIKPNGAVIYGKAVVINDVRTTRMQVSPAFAKIQHPDLVAKTNAWMAERFGYDYMVPDGQVRCAADRLVMNSRTFEQLKIAVNKTQGVYKL